jgi:hypothetical protein
MGAWSAKVTEGLLLLIVIAVVARVVWGLLGPLLPSFFVLLMIGVILLRLVQGPHSDR